MKGVLITQEKEHIHISVGSHLF